MKTATMKLQIPANPFEVIVDYLDTDGYNGHFVRQTSTDSLKKLKNQIGLPDVVNHIEIGRPMVRVAPADLPMGDNTGENIQEWRLADNWQIYASSDDGLDQDGNLIN